MTPEPASPQLTPQQRANQAHYELAKAVRELLPKFCKDPNKYQPLIDSEESLKELAILNRASCAHRSMRDNA